MPSKKQLQSPRLQSKLAEVAPKLANRTGGKDRIFRNYLIDTPSFGLENQEMVFTLGTSGDLGQGKHIMLRRHEIVPLPRPKPRRSSSTAVQIIILILGLAKCTNAGGLDDFANNIGSDLAPLLALFGEQVTKQYLRESPHAIGSLLFALAPLGIITAIVSAIRVAGSPKLRALIGRRMESYCVVEADLMSSTSSDVCELWGGGGVVRVLGCPIFLQLVYTGPEDVYSKNSGIYTFQEAVIMGIHVRPDATGYITANTDTAVDFDVEARLVRQNPPNLYMNLSMGHTDKRIWIAFAAIGVIVQGGTLIYAALAQYRFRLMKENQTVAYGFPVFLIGTLTLVFGMFLCAQVVSISTTETAWEPQEGDTTVIWLQQGGQRVGDQLFEAFAWQYKGGIITSHRSKEPDHLVWNFNLVTIAVGAALIGFVGQFTGLRALHASVTIVQLAAVLIMTALRAYVHKQRQCYNEIPDPDQVCGYELDWLARDLRKCRRWEVVTGFEYPDYSVDSSTGTTDQSNDESFAVMKIRARLARLSKDWSIGSQTNAVILQQVIEATMNDIFTTIELRDEWKDKHSFTWVIPVKAQFRGPVARERFTTLGGTSNSWKTHLTISRTKEEDTWGPWRTDRSELEAVLSLWVFSLKEDNMQRVAGGMPRLKHVRLLGPSTKQAKMDHKLWTHRGSKLCETPLDDPDVRYVGWTGVEDASDAHVRCLCVDADPGLEKLCAQELFASFTFKVVKIIERIGGTTTRHDLTADSPASKPSYQWDQFRLSNTNLSRLALHYSNSGLGTLEEGYSCIIPALRGVGKLPLLHDMYDEARKESEQLEEQGLWEEAVKIDSWLYSNCREAGQTYRDTVLLITEIENRLLRFTREIASISESDTPHEKLRVWWDLAYSGCSMLSKSSPIRAACRKNLFVTCLKVNPEQDSKTICDLMENLDINNIPMETVIDFVKLALKKELFDEAETLAHSLWASTIIQFQKSGTGRHLPAEVLVAVRRERGKFFRNQELENYLSKPECLSLTAATTAFTPVSEQEVRDHKVPIHLSEKDVTDSEIFINLESEQQARDRQVPIDLLLIRQYRTPLQMAAEIGDLQIVRRLFDGGADINADPARYSGKTALQAASSFGHERVVKFLLETGADVNAAPAPLYGRTALQAAAGGGHEKVTQLLLDYGAYVNAPAAEGGQTALMAAVEAEREKIVQLLLMAGAEISVMEGGRTALMMAVEVSNETIVKLLLQAGADVLAATEHSPSVLEVARERGNRKIISMLLESSLTASIMASDERNLRKVLKNGAEVTPKELFDDDINMEGAQDTPDSYMGI